MPSTKKNDVQIALTAYLRNNIVDPISSTRGGGNWIFAGPVPSAIDVKRPVIEVAYAGIISHLDTGLSNLGNYVTYAFDVKMYVNQKTAGTVGGVNAEGSHLLSILHERVQDVLEAGRVSLATPESWVDMDVISGTPSSGFSEVFDYLMDAIRITITVDKTTPVL